MADQLLDQVRVWVDGRIDFEGQRLAELVANTALSMVGVVAFFAGYLLQDIKLAAWITLGGTALSFVAVIPAWPWYNQHPLKWLPVGGGASHISVPQSLVIDEKSLG